MSAPREFQFVNKVAPTVMDRTLVVASLDTHWIQMVIPHAVVSHVFHTFIIFTS